MRGRVELPRVLPQRFSGPWPAPSVGWPHRDTYPRGESNPNLRLRRPASFPLDHKGLSTVGWSRTTCLLVISEAPLPRGPRRHGAESEGFEPPWGGTPIDGLARRSLTTRPALHCVASTRSAIRTRTVPVLGRLPPAVWATRASWTTSVSNRAGAVCRTALHTCASPSDLRWNGGPLR